MGFFLRCALLLLLCLLNLVLCQSENELTLLELSISENSCEFYNILDMIKPCGAHGYTTEFAYKYCQAYLDKRDDFKDEKWNNGVRVCLQRAMLSKLQSAKSSASCAQIKDWGFGSHFGCYMHPIPNSPSTNFCRLPATDIAKIGWIAKGAVFEWEVIKQFAQMTKQCAGQYLQDVNEDFVNFLKKTMSKLEWL